jgi:hypothetical protein
VRTEGARGKRSGFLGGCESDAHHDAAGDLPPGEVRRLEAHVVASLPHVAHGSRSRRHNAGDLPSEMLLERWAARRRKPSQIGFLVVAIW